MKTRGGDKTRGKRKKEREERGIEGGRETKGRRREGHRREK